MSYIPHTASDQQEMMDAIGIHAIDDLFNDIPQKFRLLTSLDLPAALSEQDIAKLLKGHALQNRVPRMTLMGAGAYHHYIPAVVRHVVSRSEFYTAYTPYQAEISQGILQAIYEYQTMIASLTGMQVANASMYDGASAMAEAAVLAAKSTGRTRIIMARSVHPEYRQVVRTYAWSNGYEIVEVDYETSGQVNLNSLAKAIDDQVAAVIVQSPNFFGVIEDVAALAEVVHSRRSLMISGFTEATSLGILKPPGALGADMVVGEGQAFGNSLNYGGPYLGIMAGTTDFLRKIPGRLSGATLDRQGRRGFVLTLQTREQHIRRERATSNICTNEALCALAAAVYLVSLGKNLKKLAEINVQKAVYLRKRLCDLKGWRPVFTGPCYNEFVVHCPDAAAANQRLQTVGIVGGYEVGKDYPELKDCLLLCATEMLSKEDIDQAANVLSRA